MLGGNSDAQQELLIPGEVKDDCQTFKHNSPTSTFLYGVGTVDRLPRAGVLELFSAQTRLGQAGDLLACPLQSSLKHQSLQVLRAAKRSCFCLNARGRCCPASGIMAAGLLNVKNLTGLAS